MQCSIFAASNTSVDRYCVKMIHICINKHVGRVKDYVQNCRSGLPEYISERAGLQVLDYSQRVANPISLFLVANDAKNANSDGTYWVSQIVGDLTSLVFVFLFPKLTE